MPAIQFLANLSLLKERIWTTDLSDREFERCKNIAAELMAELEVYEALADTTRWLCTTNTVNKGYKKSCAARRSRISKVLKEVQCDLPEPKARFQALGQLDVKTLMFIAASYTVLHITKLAQNTFESLIKMGPRYVSKTVLPTDWILREEFQVAVAQSAEPGGTLKRSMYAHSVSYQRYSPIPRVSGTRVCGSSQTSSYRYP
jgi:hypothetical protein